MIDSIILAVEKKIKDAPYDKTVQGRIIEILPKNKCKVLIDGKEFKVRTKASHSVNEVVDICIPQNNYHKMYVVPNGASSGDITGDTKNCTISFVEASQDIDVISGDTHSTIVGKLVKNIKSIKSLIGSLTNLTTNNKDNLVSSINEVKERADSAFQSASDGKLTIKSAITGKDGSIVIPDNPTFSQLSNAIGQIKTGVDVANGTALISSNMMTFNSMGSNKSAYYVDVSGFNFSNMPKLIIIDIDGYGYYGAMTIYINLSGSNDYIVWYIDESLTRQLYNSSGGSGGIVSNNRFLLPVKKGSGNAVWTAISF